MSKLLVGGVIGCKFNTKPFHGIQTGSPMVVTLGQQSNTGEKPTVMLYTYYIINRHTGTPDKNKTKQFQYIIK